MTISPDGGKILITGKTASFLYLGVSAATDATFSNFIMYMDSSGNKIWVKSYGYGTFWDMIGKNIVFDSNGEYFYERLDYLGVITDKWKHMLKRTLLSTMTDTYVYSMGTSTGDITSYKGFVLTSDDSYIISPSKS